MSELIRHHSVSGYFDKINTSSLEYPRFHSNFPPYMNDWREALYNVVRYNKVLSWDFSISANTEDIKDTDAVDNLLSFPEDYKKIYSMPSHSKVLSHRIKHISKVLSIMEVLFKENESKKYNYGKPPHINGTYLTNISDYYICEYFSDLRGIQKLKINIDVSDYYLYFTNFTINIIISCGVYEYYIITRDDSNEYSVSNPDDGNYTDYDGDD